MPHPSFEFSRGLRRPTDLDAFAGTGRDALVAAGAFPLDGIRVRDVEASAQAVVGGDRTGGGRHFSDMVLKLGEGCDAGTRGRIADELHAAAEAARRPDLANTPFALNLEVQETRAALSRKSWSTIQPALVGAGR